jgi:hypothetical protein
MMATCPSYPLACHHFRIHGFRLFACIPLPQCSCTASSGPQHEALGEKAIEYYQRGVDTFLAMGLDAQDKDYGASLYNMGNVYKV